MPTLPPIEHENVTTNGVRLHVATAGPEDGDPIVLLHGFPEFWYGWRHQLGPLAEAGYRLVVPDQRGYNRSEKPSGVDAYALDELGRDAVGLLDALGHDSARFVGHDWGAAVTWQVLLAHPDRVERAVAMNVPHHAVFQEYLTGRPSQMCKSWYMFFFQLPRVPELVFGADDWRVLRWFVDTSNREDTFTTEDLDRYREAWSRPGAFTGMVNWYRAMFQADTEAPPTMTVEPPTMLVWGTQDPYLHREMAPASVDHCRDGRLELFEDATHWVQHECADRVNDLLLEFL
jgi:pimeloyl-ACP methyl ester carboxylesterase